MFQWALDDVCNRNEPNTKLHRNSMITEIVEYKKALTVCIIQRAEGEHIDSATACVKHNPSCAIKAKRMNFVFVNFTSLNHPVSNAKRLVGYFGYLLVFLSLSLAHSLAFATILRLDDQSVLSLCCCEWSNYRYTEQEQLTMKTLKM